MIKLKYRQGERRDLYHKLTDDEAKCSHCSVILKKNSKNIKNYDGHGYLCEDCKFLVCESIRKRGK